MFAIVSFISRIKKFLSSRTKPTSGLNVMEQPSIPTLIFSARFLIFSPASKTLPSSLAADSIDFTRSMGSSQRACARSRSDLSPTGKFSSDLSG